MRRLLFWFVDDEDPLYSPWRGVALWVVVLLAFIAIGLLISQTGSSGDSGGDQGCPNSYQAAGWC